MKKFTKGCLITALTLFIFGAAFYGICGFMGGFSQLRERGIMRGNGMFSIGIPGYEWGLNSQLFSFWNWSDDWDWSDEWDDRWDDWSNDAYRELHLLKDGESGQTEYTASDITGIDIELGGCSLVIAESEDSYIRIENLTDKQKVKYGVKNGIFKLYSTATYRFWGNVSRGTVYLYLPQDMNLNMIDIEMGAGNLESIDLSANEIDLEAGAGGVIAEGLYGSEIDVMIGAGKAEIGTITANMLSIESGAGGIIIGNADVKELDLEAAAGMIELTGTVRGNIGAECSAGNIGLTLYASENDYDYEIEYSVGAITINGYEYNGLAAEKSIRNGAGKEMDLECAAGSISVEFVR